MSNVEWLLREAMDERTLRISERAVFDDASWRATIERLQIGRASCRERVCHNV